MRKQSMSELLSEITSMLIEGNFKDMLGGAPVTQDFAEQIGADGYASNAASASDLAKELTI